MAGDFELRITGIREIQRALVELSPRLAIRINQAVLKKGANYMLREIKASAPQGATGRLKKSFKVRNSKINTLYRNQIIGVYLKSNRGKKRDDPAGAYYTYFQERGWNSGKKASANEALRGAVRGFAHNSPRGQVRRDYRFRNELHTTRHGQTRNYAYRVRGGGKDIPGKHFIENTFDRTEIAATEIITRAAEIALTQTARNLNLNITGG
jgi:hypothetical protein